MQSRLLLPLVALAVAGLLFQQFTLYLEQQAALQTLSLEGEALVARVEAARNTEATTLGQLADAERRHEALRIVLPRALQSVPFLAYMEQLTTQYGIKILSSSEALYSRPRYREAVLTLSLATSLEKAQPLLQALAQQPRLIRLDLPEQSGRQSIHFSLTLYAADQAETPTAALPPCQPMPHGVWLPPLRSYLDALHADYRESCRLAEEGKGPYLLQLQLQALQAENDVLQQTIDQLAPPPEPRAVTTAYLRHPTCLLHEMGCDHPESPQRLLAIDRHLAEQGLEQRLLRVEAPRASREAILRVHHADYLQRLEQLAPAEGYRPLDPDTTMNPHTLEAALRAAGAAVHAVDLVLGGEADNAFCAVRPPGHHAEPGRAMGFCLFNNIAIAAAHALEAHGLERVAIVDFDVHHGNGTETMFGGDGRVLLCSSFQHPFYPGTRLDEAAANILLVPLRAGDGGEALRSAYRKRLLPALDDFAPQLLLISAGFDGHVEDGISGLALVDDDYRWLSEGLSEVAACHAGGRIVSLLEGGYALEGLGRCTALHIRTLIDAAS